MPLSRYNHPARYLFFGKDARPIAEIVMRRHPLAMALYAIVFSLGMIFVFHWYAKGVNEAALFPHVSPWAIIAWKWMMVTGGGGALTCLSLRPRPAPGWPDLSDLLHLEGIAGFVGGTGMLVYLIVIVHLHGFHDGGPAFILYGLVVAGHYARAWQAMWDASRLQRLATMASDAQEVRDERDAAASVE